MQTITENDVRTTTSVLRSMARGPMSAAVNTLSERVTLLTLHVSERAGETVAMGELGRRIGLSRAAISTLAIRLETVGLVRRVERGGGTKELVLTSAGADVIAAALAHGDQAVPA